VCVYDNYHTIWFRFQCSLPGEAWGAHGVGWGVSGCRRPSLETYKAVLRMLAERRRWKESWDLAQSLATAAEGEPPDPEVRQSGKKRGD
jgi:hypothetical protein